MAAGIYAAYFYGSFFIYVLYTCVSTAAMASAHLASVSDESMWLMIPPDILSKQTDSCNQYEPS
jgi:hypothetical protein